MFDWLFIALIGIFGLSLLVLIHEAGHYLAARWCGVDVEAFSIGFGPVLFSFTHAGTSFRLSLIPLGGYCRLKGETDLSGTSHASALPGSFGHAHPAARAFIAAAGPLANVILAFVLFTTRALLPTTDYVSPPLITLADDFPSQVDPATPLPSIAARGGLRTGDLITQVDGTPISTFQDLARITRTSALVPLNITYVRDGISTATTLTPALHPTKGIGYLGIFAHRPLVVTLIRSSPIPFMLGDTITHWGDRPITSMLELTDAMERHPTASSLTVRRDGTSLRLSVPVGTISSAADFGILIGVVPSTVPGRNLWEASANGVQNMGDTLLTIIHTFALLPLGLDPTSVFAGPVRTIHVIGDPIVATARFDLYLAFHAFLGIIAAISIALAFANLLPIPALDGGLIILSLFEWIRHHAISPKALKAYHALGFGLVCALLAMALWGDVMALIEGL